MMLIENDSVHKEELENMESVYEAFLKALDCCAYFAIDDMVCYNTNFQGDMEKCKIYRIW